MDSGTDEGRIDYGRFEDGRHCNYWALDRTLQREARRIYTDVEYEWAEPRLAEFGELVGHTIADNADRVDAQGPVLETYDRHGNVQNFVRYPAQQLENDELVYERGIVADAFRPPPGREEPMPLSHYLAGLYLLCYADAGFGCPVAMTAGAALVLEKFDEEGALADYYDALTSRTYDDLIEGAMFLTEEQGGSDVGAIETEAVYDEETGYWRLTGEKWFCSNVDAEGTLTLARTPGAPDGTAGLSMFLVPHSDPDTGAGSTDETAGGDTDDSDADGDGVLTKGDRRDGPPEPADVNDQLYRRLKDKLGTIAVPTGEVEFRGAKAFLVGEEEKGFRQMAEMLNLERLSNAAASCGLIGRALLESKVQAANREVFGNPIDQYPLMREDLVDMAVDHEAATAFTFEAARLLSEYEARSASERGARRSDGRTRDEHEVQNDSEPGAGRSESTTRDERERAERAAGDDDVGVDMDDGDVYRLMRLLVPIAKLRTGRVAVDTASYAMEIQGGNGYVNDFVTHRLLRDAQVLPIWEGTENVLSLDVLRALERETAHEPLLATIRARLDAVSNPVLADAVEAVEAEYDGLSTALATLATEDDEYVQLSAKRLAHYVFDVFTAALLLAEAQADLDGAGPAGENDGSTRRNDARTALVARRFVERELTTRKARGIAGGDRFPIEHFDAIVRYAPVDPESLDAPSPDA